MKNDLLCLLNIFLVKQNAAGYHPWPIPPSGADGVQSFTIWDFFPVKCLRHIELSLPTAASAIFEENISPDEWRNSVKKYKTMKQWIKKCQWKIVEGFCYKSSEWIFCNRTIEELLQDKKMLRFDHKEFFQQVQNATGYIRVAIWVLIEPNRSLLLSRLSRAINIFLYVKIQDGAWRDSRIPIKQGDDW